MERKSQRFAMDVVRLASGTAIAQALTILATPVITRLYGPVAFGVAALFTSITAVVIAVSCLRYELAIPLSESDGEGASLLVLSIASVVLFTLVSALVLVVAGKPLLVSLRAGELVPYMWLMPIAIMVGGTCVAMNYWMTRRRAFGTLARSRITRSVGIVGSQLSAGFGGHTTGLSLIAASIIGPTASALYLGTLVWRRSRTLVGGAMTWQAIIACAKRYRKFPIYSTWSILLNSLSWQLPVLLLAFFFSTQTVGYYALSASLLGLPMNLIGNSVAQVFYQSAATAKDSQELSDVVERTFRQLVRLGMFPLLLIALLGQDLFQVAFGHQWGEAGVYSQILSIWILFWFISSPLSTLPSIFEKQEFDLKFNALLLSGRFAALAIGGYVGNARVAVALFSLAGVVIYGYLSVVVLRMAKVSLTRAARTMVTQFAVFAPVGILIIGLDIFGVVNEWVRLGIAGVSLIVYGWYKVRKHPLVVSIGARFGLA